ncbi:hypothetical protein HK100_012698 [Physocladia obscura]|uniref:Zinc finger PHD-type domain-containing protein n=1 Tax=Physocladia obscura TaxID=109957 RepID=A0AAD5SZX2_9FUNG|nr:hypothetical protein HK100_012698 [Physocladia obscura]
MSVSSCLMPQSGAALLRTNNDSVSININTSSSNSHNNYNNNGQSIGELAEIQKVNFFLIPQTVVTKPSSVQPPPGAPIPVSASVPTISNIANIPSIRTRNSPNLNLNCATINSDYLNISGNSGNGNYNNSSNLSHIRTPTYQVPINQHQVRTLNSIMDQHHMQSLHPYSAGQQPQPQLQPIQYPSGQIQSAATTMATPDPLFFFGQPLPPLANDPLIGLGMGDFSMDLNLGGLFGADPLFPMSQSSLSQQQPHTSKQRASEIKRPSIEVKSSLSVEDQSILSDDNSRRIFDATKINNSVASAMSDSTISISASYKIEHAPESVVTVVSSSVVEDGFKSHINFESKGNSALKIPVSDYAKEIYASDRFLSSLIETDGPSVNTVVENVSLDAQSPTPNLQDESVVDTRIEFLAFDVIDSENQNQEVNLDCEAKKPIHEDIDEFERISDVDSVEEFSSILMENDLIRISINPEFEPELPAKVCPSPTIASKLIEKLPEIQSSADSKEICEEINQPLAASNINISTKLSESHQQNTQATTIIPSGENSSLFLANTAIVCPVESFKTIIESMVALVTTPNSSPIDEPAVEIPFLTVESKLDDKQDSISNEVLESSIITESINSEIKDDGIPALLKPIPTLSDAKVSEEMHGYLRLTNLSMELVNPSKSEIIKLPSSSVSIPSVLINRQCDSEELDTHSLLLEETEKPLSLLATSITTMKLNDDLDFLNDPNDFCRSDSNRESLETEIVSKSKAAVVAATLTMLIDSCQVNRKDGPVSQYPVQPDTVPENDASEHDERKDDNLRSQTVVIDVIKIGKSSSSQDKVLDIPDVDSTNAKQGLNILADFNQTEVVGTSHQFCEIADDFSDASVDNTEETCNNSKNISPGIQEATTRIDCIYRDNSLSLRSVPHSAISHSGGGAFESVLSIESVDKFLINDALNSTLENRVSEFAKSAVSVETVLSHNTQLAKLPETVNGAESSVTSEFPHNGSRKNASGNAKDIKSAQRFRLHDMEAKVSETVKILVSAKPFVDLENEVSESVKNIVSVELLHNNNTQFPDLEHKVAETVTDMVFADQFLGNNIRLTDFKDEMRETPESLKRSFDRKSQYVDLEMKARKAVANVESVQPFLCNDIQSADLVDETVEFVAQPFNSKSPYDALKYNVRETVKSAVYSLSNDSPSADINDKGLEYIKSTHQSLNSDGLHAGTSKTATNMVFVKPFLNHDPRLVLEDKSTETVAAVEQPFNSGFPHTDFAYLEKNASDTVRNVQSAKQFLNNDILLVDLGDRVSKPVSAVSAESLADSEKKVSETIMNTVLGKPFLGDDPRIDLDDKVCQRVKSLVFAELLSKSDPTSEKLNRGLQVQGEATIIGISEETEIQEQNMANQDFFLDQSNVATSGELSSPKLKILCSESKIPDEMAQSQTIWVNESHPQVTAEENATISTQSIWLQDQKDDFLLQEQQVLQSPRRPEEIAKSTSIVAQESEKTIRKPIKIRLKTLGQHQHSRATSGGSSCAVSEYGGETIPVVSNIPDSAGKRIKTINFSDARQLDNNEEAELPGNKMKKLSKKRSRQSSISGVSDYLKSKSSSRSSSPGQIRIPLRLPSSSVAQTSTAVSTSKSKRIKTEAQKITLLEKAGLISGQQGLLMRVRKAVERIERKIVSGSCGACGDKIGEGRGLKCGTCSIEFHSVCLDFNDSGNVQNYLCNMCKVHESVSLSTSNNREPSSAFTSGLTSIAEQLVGTNPREFILSKSTKKIASARIKRRANELAQTPTTMITKQEISIEARSISNQAVKAGAVDDMDTEKYGSNEIKNGSSKNSIQIGTMITAGQRQVTQMNIIGDNVAMEELRQANKNFRFPKFSEVLSVPAVKKRRMSVASVFSLPQDSSPADSETGATMSMLQHQPYLNQLPQLTPANTIYRISEAKIMTDFFTRIKSYKIV